VSPSSVKCRSPKDRRAHLFITGIKAKWIFDLSDISCRQKRYYVRMREHELIVFFFCCLLTYVVNNSKLAFERYSSRILAGTRASLMFSRLSSVTPYILQESIMIRSLSLLSKFFPIHNSLIVLFLESVYSEILAS
jgi:hypothetical protein